MRLPLFRLLFRKMWSTRLLTISTLIGLIVAVSFTTSIPMYADGALKRVVSQTLQDQESGLPAGSLLIRYQAAGREITSLEELAQVQSFIQNDVRERIGHPSTTYVEYETIRSSQITPLDASKVDASKRRQLSLGTMSDLSEHSELVLGKWPSSTVSGGVVEVAVLYESRYRNDFEVGDEFVYPISGGHGIAPLTVRIVGAFEPLDESDPYWFQGLESLYHVFFAHEDVFHDYILKDKNVPLSTANWFYVFDLSEIRTSELTPLSKKLERLDIELYQQLKNTKIDISFASLLEEFKSQSMKLQSMLLTLVAPILAMVFYFIVMIARQSLERQRSDIAVLQSRGASSRQIFAIYLLESMIPGIIALITGPIIGWFMAKVIGSANGFLTFVNRDSIPLGFNVTTILYALITVIIAIAASVIPALHYARTSVVNLRQRMARADRAPVWQRWFLDIALIGVAGYGWYLFKERQLISLQTGISSDQLQTQPLLFFVPAITIFAIGLVFLRFFPWLLRLINWLGRRVLSVPMYLTLTQLARSARSYYPIMLLLTLTIGLGVYNASAARTIELNDTERTLYQYGADVVIQTVWDGYTETLPNVPAPPNQGQNPGGNPGGPGSPGGNPGGPGGGPGGQPGGSSPIPTRVYYVEPPFEIFRDLEGVKAVTRVLQTRGSIVVSGKSAGQGIIMGIDNVDFARIAWFGENLYPAHPHAYLSVMGEYEQAALIPKTLAERYQIKPGDLISVSMQQQSAEFVVVAIIPYWPSQYPDKTPFIVANLDYIYDQFPMTPYDVWLKMEDGAKVMPIIEKLAEQNIEVASVKDVRNELIRQGRHPSRGGVFGILSLGFLVSVFITLIGYILYWFFNLASRQVQFGVLRAMGLARKQLTMMLLLEQIFTAGISIALGFAIGRVTSYLYLPFLQTSADASLQVPPFRVVFNIYDSIQLYVVIAAMILIGAILLIGNIRKMRIHQAVKLGEER